MPGSGSARVISIDLNAGFGGIEAYLERLSALITENAELFALVQLPELAARLRVHGVRVIKLPQLPHALRGLNILAAAALLPLIVTKHEIGTVHTNGYADILCLVPSKVLRRRTIATRHQVFEIDVPFMRAPSRYLARWLYLRLAPIADLIVCVSGAVGRDLSSRSPRSMVRVIPNWVATLPPYSPRPQPGGKFHILFVSRLVEQKGLHILLDAIRPLSNVKLTVVGDGPGRDALETQARGLDVSFEGFQDPTSAYRSADLFVGPYLGPEGMPLVPLEAMSNGLPCILSDIPVHCEISNDGNDALLFRNGLPLDLQEKITKVMGSHELRERLSRCGYEAVKAKYSTSAARAAYSEVFQIGSAGENSSNEVHS